MWNGFCHQFASNTEKNLMNWGWISDFDYKPPAPAVVVIPTSQNQHVRLIQNVVQL
jgi:hypothetical protein